VANADLVGRNRTTQGLNETRLASRLAA